MKKLPELIVKGWEAGLDEKDEWLFTPAKVLLDGEAKYSSILPGFREITVAILMQEFANQSGIKVEERLLVANSGIRHSHLLRFDRLNDQDNLLEDRDIISFRWEISDILPIVINSFSQAFQDRFYEDTAFLIALGRNCWSESKVILFDVLSDATYPIFELEEYIEKVGKIHGGGWQIRLRYEHDELFADFHSNFVTLDSEVSFSIALTDRLKETGWDKEKTAMIHRGMVRAYPPFMTLEEVFHIPDEREISADK